jgi:hypothetical protein
MLAGGAVLPACKGGSNGIPPTSRGLLRCSTELVERREEDAG